MIKLPKISIVTPNYNSSKYIEQTIQSVLGQGYPYLEYIVIDGGSTDRSVEIIKKYESELAYWISEPDSGHAHALNKGFAKATGDIMAWINSDDMYFPWTFKAISEIFNKYNDVFWIKGLHSKFSDNGILLSSNPVFKNIFDFAQKDYKWIQQESVFWTKDLWERAGGFINEEYKFMVDGELWTRFFLLEELWHVNIPLGGLRQHAGRRAPNNMDEVLNEMERCIDKMNLNLPKEITTTLSKINDRKSALKEYDVYIDKLKKRKSLKILPAFIYNRVLATIIKKKKILFKDSGDDEIERARHCYKTIHFSQTGFEKKVMLNDK